MDSAVLNVKKGQDITIIIEGYEDHAASFDYDDVLQVILQQAQNDLNKRRNKRHQERYESEMKAKQSVDYANAAAGCGTQIPSGMPLYPR